jgi:hypothetical protein
MTTIEGWDIGKLPLRRLMMVVYALVRRAQATHPGMSFLPMTKRTLA